MEATNECTAIVAYKVRVEDVDTFLDAWGRANNHLKSQPGHLSTTLHRASSANPAFRFVNVAKWKSQDDFRKATQSIAFREVAGSLVAYPVRAAVYDVVC